MISRNIDLEKIRKSAGTYFDAVLSLCHLFFAGTYFAAQKEASCKRYKTVFFLLQNMHKMQRMGRSVALGGQISSKVLHVQALFSISD